MKKESKLVQMKRLAPIYSNQNLKLAFPVAIAAILLVVADVGSGRAYTRTKSGERTDKFIELVEPLEKPARRASKLVGGMMDTFADIAKIGWKGFQRNPDGAPNR